LEWSESYFFWNYPLEIHIIHMYSVPMIRKELVAASAEPLILSPLAKGESYGYAIIQEVKVRFDGHLNWTDGQAIKRMCLYWILPKR